MKKKISFQTTIPIPSNVLIEKKKDSLLLTGPFGWSTIDITKLDQHGSVALFLDNEKKSLHFAGNLKPTFTLITKIINTKLEGVSQGYLLYLRLVGIGYRCSLKDKVLNFKVGYSHDIQYLIPDSIRVFLIEPTLVCLFGLDKNQITQIAAQIRRIRPPSPYKGKGIRFLGEIIRVKQGKQK